MAEPGWVLPPEWTFFFSKTGSVSGPNEQEVRFNLKAQHAYNFAASNPRLGHAASIVRRANGRSQIVPAAGYDFGASPYQSVGQVGVSGVPSGADPL
jgi:hypothetical protein